MNEKLNHLKDVSDRVLWPDPRRRDRMAVARRVVGVATVVGTLVQIVVWLMIGVVAGSLGGPWWLLSAIGCATLAASLSYVDEHRPQLGLRHDGGEVR